MTLGAIRSNGRLPIWFSSTPRSTNGSTKGPLGATAGDEKEQYSNPNWPRLWEYLQFSRTLLPLGNLQRTGSPGRRSSWSSIQQLVDENTSRLRMHCPHTTRHGYGTGIHPLWPISHRPTTTAECNWGRTPGVCSLGLITWGRTPGVCSLGWVKSDQTLGGSSSTKSLLIAKRGTCHGRWRINLFKFSIPFILNHSNWSGQIDSQSQIDSQGQSMVKGRLNNYYGYG